MTALRALCLDLDDTILDEQSSTEEGWRRAAEQWAEACPQLSCEAGLAELALARRWYWEDAARERRGRLDLHAARLEIMGRALARRGPAMPGLALALARELTRFREERQRLVPGARELLGRLRRKVSRMALVTNGASAPQRGKIERFALAEFFDHIQIEGEFGSGKPDRRVYEHVLGRLGAAPEESMMVGDNFICDVAGPLALGMRAAWVHSPGAGPSPDTAERPYLTLGSILELPIHLAL
ncbi:MAG TPA: HAD family hydrolase [Myxococcota bacterium]|nr:HAD family hydrolase [Myxococcota bacterium]